MTRDDEPSKYSVKAAMAEHKLTQIEVDLVVASAADWRDKETVATLVENMTGSEIKISRVRLNAELDRLALIGLQISRTLEKVRAALGEDKPDNAYSDYSKDKD